METYHKIQTLFKREQSGPNKGRMLEGQWTTPELAYLAGNEWEFTEKVDGMNVRVGYFPDDDWNVQFAGRSDNADIPKHLMEYLQDTFTPGLFKDADLASVTLFGEGYGPKIQSGGKYREDHSFVLFDVKIGGWWLTRDNVNAIAEKLGIDSVPVIGYGTLQDAIDMVSDKAISRYCWPDGSASVPGLRSKWGLFEAEGIVARPVVPMFDRNGNRIITKIKAVDFK